MTYPGYVISGLISGRARGKRPGKEQDEGEMEGEGGRMLESGEGEDGEGEKTVAETGSRRCDARDPRGVIQDSGTGIEEEEEEVMVERGGRSNSRRKCDVITSLDMDNLSKTASTDV